MKMTPYQKKLRAKKRANAPKPAKPLTALMQKFVDCYDGDLRHTAEVSGISYSYCNILLGMPKIKDKLKIRNIEEDRPADIANRQERQRFWTAIMNGKKGGKKLTMRDRLKASELLGRSEADFTDNHVVDDKRTLIEVLKRVGQDG